MTTSTLREDWSQQVSSFTQMFPEWRETLVPLWEYEGMLKVIRTGNVLKIRLRNSSSLTWLNLTLTSEVPSYNPRIFNQSFSWATVDEESGIDIGIIDGSLPHDADDLIFIYLATVFGSYIWTGERMEMNCLAIAMSLRWSWMIDTHQKIKRFIEICGMNGTNFQESRSPERVIRRENQRVQDVVTPPPPLTSAREISLPQNWPWLPSHVLRSVVEDTWNQTERLVTQIPPTRETRDPSQWIGLFIRSLEDKSPTRALKLLETAIRENRYGETWTLRLQALLDVRNEKERWSQNQWTNPPLNPKEFIDSLTGSLWQQIGQLERQIKRWKKYGDAYVATLVKHKQVIESRLSRK